MKTNIEQFKKNIQENENLKEMYNFFVETLENKSILVSKIKIYSGISKLSKQEALRFDINTDFGFTDKEAENIFADFIKKFPSCSISYNKYEASVLEDVLMQKSESFVQLSEGFKLSKI